jgi:hypothetical protein
MKPTTVPRYGQAIIELVAELFPPQDQDRWMLTPHSSLNGDWPSLAMQKGNEEAVCRLLLRLKQGN